MGEGRPCLYKPGDLKSGLVKHELESSLWVLSCWARLEPSLPHMCLQTYLYLFPFFLLPSYQNACVTLLHLNPKLQIFCSLSFLLSNSQASTFPLPLLLIGPPLGFNFTFVNKLTSPMTSLLSPGHILWTWPLLTLLHYFTQLADLSKSIFYPKYWLLHSSGFFMVSVLETFNWGISVTLITSWKYADNFQVSVSSLWNLTASRSLHSSLWNLTAYQVFRLLGSFTEWSNKEPTSPAPKLLQLELGIQLDVMVPSFSPVLSPSIHLLPFTSLIYLCSCLDYCPHCIQKEVFKVQFWLCKTLCPCCPQSGPVASWLPSELLFL